MGFIGGVWGIGWSNPIIAETSRERSMLTSLLAEAASFLLLALSNPAGAKSIPAESALCPRGNFARRSAWVPTLRCGSCVLPAAAKEFDDGRHQGNTHDGNDD